MAGVTIKDIAAAAGVSHPTVSKALNGSPGVNEMTRQRILKIARQMNYAPNLAARNLANKKNRSMGLIWPQAEGLFFYHLCESLQRRANKCDIDVFVSMAKPARALRNFHEHMVDYVVHWNTPAWMPDAAFIKAQESFTGQLTILGGGAAKGANRVEIDRARGVMDAVAYLAGIGHRRIAFVGEESEKTAGYMRGVLEYGLDFSPEHIITAPDGFYYGGSDRGEMDARFSRLWEGPNRPTALMLDSQGSAFAMINTILRLGIRIPQDLSVITYDDIPELSIYPVELDTCSPAIEDIIDLVLKDYERFFAKGEVMSEALAALVPKLTIRHSTRRLTT